MVNSQWYIGLKDVPKSFETLVIPNSPVKRLHRIGPLVRLFFLSSPYANFAGNVHTRQNLHAFPMLAMASIP